MAHSTADNFFKESPEKVYQNAITFSKTLSRFTQLPTSIPKSKYVKAVAEDRKDDVRYAIDEAKYQNSLYRRLQVSDQKNRRQIAKKIQEKDIKNDKNLEELKKKHEKECERLDKHLEQVYKKHVDLQKSRKAEKDQQALKLRKSLLEFYDKERERRKEADAKQISVSSCYHNAVNRLDRIHQQNQEYAQKTERQHLLRMAKNSAKQKVVLNLSRMKSLENKKKEVVYDANCEIMEQNQQHHIQTYCKDLDISIKAFQFKDTTDAKTKQRIHKFFKQRAEKWHSNKKRVDQEKEHIPDKCINILDKTTKASFRKTISSFKQSSKNWYNKVQLNKSMIYESDERQKDRLMDTHVNMTMRNTSSFKVNEKMGSMRNQAKKLSYQFM